MEGAKDRPDLRVSARGGERPIMGTAACGGRGFEGRAGGRGERPTGAAGCRQLQTAIDAGVMPNLPRSGLFALIGGRGCSERGV